MSARRFAGNGAAALVGALVVLGVDGLTRPTSPGPTARPRVEARPLLEPPRVHRSSTGRVLLAWSPGGVPAGTEAMLESIAGVREATTIVAGVDWMRGSRAPDGTPVDAPARGYAIPLEVAIVEPRGYAAFVPAAERDAVLGLGRADALIAETEAAIRDGGSGLTLDLGGRTVRVSAVVSDIATNGYEALMTGPVPASWTRADRFVLVRLGDARRRAAVRRRLLEFLPPGQVLRIRARGETPFLRYGDAVQSQMIIKRNFGEFAARPNPDGTLDIEPGWVRRNIRTARVPVLGDVMCHRALFPQLREALRAVVARGIAYTIDRGPGGYGGCFSPRFISRQPGGRLSHHAWGIAVDVNVSDNEFGTPPDLDPRLIDVMEAWGFTWGGRWLIPDGMHFEWNRWP